RRPYRQFYEEVMRSRAAARVRVEAEVRQKDPRFWLRHGPGRETPTRPGWTNPARPAPARRSRAADPLTSPHWLKIWSVLSQVLVAFPEAHSAVVRALNEMPPDPPTADPRQAPPQNPSPEGEVKADQA